MVCREKIRSDSRIGSSKGRAREDETSSGTHQGWRCKKEARISTKNGITALILTNSTFSHSFFFFWICSGCLTQKILVEEPTRRNSQYLLINDCCTFNILYLPSTSVSQILYKNLIIMIIIIIILIKGGMERSDILNSAQYMRAMPFVSRCKQFWRMLIKKTFRLKVRLIRTERNIYFA